MIRLRLIPIVLLMLPMIDTEADAQPKGYRYDEAKVPEFDLPDPLLFENGNKVETAEDWTRRRAEIFRKFETLVYGKAPGSVEPKILESKTKSVLDGKALQRQYRLQLTENGPQVDLLVFLPAKHDRPVPCFLGLNFSGNHTIFDDPDIAVTDSWVRNDKSVSAEDHRASPDGRGKKSSRWPVELVIDSGFGMATAYYGDIDPDFDDGFKNGIHAHLKAGTSETPARDEWGSISAWAWGLSRLLDVLESDADVDADQVYVLGHSRLGKTALWAGASDERFAGVISNNSGCGGAALSKRGFGETVKRINTSFPHWFCDNFNQFNDNEKALPIDQHMLVAICAPRPVYVASASQDLWADPRGEFLSVKLASPVYELLTGQGLDVDEFPPVNQPSIGVLSYHRREGKHDLTPFDWKQYIKFARKNGKSRQPSQ